jgi:hypothetical protein
MENKFTRRRIRRWILGVLVILLSFLFMECRSYPFGSMLADKNDNYFNFINALDTAHNFDRIAFLRLVIDDPDHILGGLTKWLRLSPPDHQESIVLCDITYNRGTGRGFDIIIAFQAKTDSVVLRNLVCFDFTIGSYGRKTSEKKVDFPLEQTFSLVPGAVNYLGRFHLTIDRSGPSETSIMTGSYGNFSSHSVNTPIRYSIGLSRDDACFREDLDQFRARNPKMRLPENIVKSPAK